MNQILFMSNHIYLMTNVILLQHNNIDHLFVQYMILTKLLIITCYHFISIFNKSYMIHQYFLQLLSIIFLLILIVLHYQFIQFHYQI